MFLKLSTITLHKHLRMGYWVLEGGMILFLEANCMPVEVNKLFFTPSLTIARTLYIQAWTVGFKYNFFSVCLVRRAFCIYMSILFGEAPSMVRYLFS